jgi:hypothetical protein
MEAAKQSGATSGISRRPAKVDVQIKGTVQGPGPRIGGGSRHARASWLSGGVVAIHSPVAQVPILLMEIKGICQTAADDSNLGVFVQITGFPAS